jgi:predicted type IV restriction endonuclease
MEELQERVTRMLETLTFEQLEMVIKYAESLNRHASEAFDNDLVVLLEDEVSAA